MNWRSKTLPIFMALIASSAVLAQDAETPLHAGRSAIPASTLSVEEQAAIKKEARQIIGQATREIGLRPGNKQAWSARGDAWFKLGKFSQAVRDYDRMVDLDPQEDSSHWRRGIAYFYAEEFKKAAGQFERYHTFDDVDRENGIWRFLSQHKAYGQKAARKGLLKYRKDDREPFPSVYKLFAGETTSIRILDQIDAAKVSKNEREKRLFYAHLYAGLNDAVEGNSKSAIQHLRKSTANTWGRTAGFGPNYMWHVGRIHLIKLLNAKAN